MLCFQLCWHFKENVIVTKLVKSWCMYRKYVYGHVLNAAISVIYLDGDNSLHHFLCLHMLQLI